MPFNTPVEVVEGYADYVAKSDPELLSKLTQAWLDDSPRMNPENGLYDRYTLYVAYLLETKGFTFSQLLEEQPDMTTTLDEITQNAARAESSVSVD